MKDVLRVANSNTLSALSKQRWIITLSCGHQIWIVRRKRPMAKKLACPEKCDK